MTTVNTPAELATRATALLVAVAEQRPHAVPALQTELYPILYRAARKRAASLSSVVRIGSDGVAVPAIPEADRDSVAHDVTVHALNSLARNASRFDPDRGDGISWALRQINYSHVDVVRATYNTRRSLRVVPTSDEQLIPAADGQRPSGDPAVIVEMRQALQAALDSLTLEERQVILATDQQGYSYIETAEIVFGDRAAITRVDHTRRRAKAKLALLSRTSKRRPSSEAAISHGSLSPNPLYHSAQPSDYAAEKVYSAFTGGPR